MKKTIIIIFSFFTTKFLMDSNNLKFIQPLTFQIIMEQFAH